MNLNLMLLGRCNVLVAQLVDFFLGTTSEYFSLQYSQFAVVRPQDF